MRRKRLGSLAAIAVAAVLLSGCGQWYGRAYFQHHADGGGLGGGVDYTEVTEYVVEPGQRLAKVTATYDGWRYDNDGLPPFPGSGCVANGVHLQGTATAYGYVHVVEATASEPAKLFVGLLTSEVTYSLAVTESWRYDGQGTSSCGILDVWPYGRGTFETRGTENPQRLIGPEPNGAVNPRTADGGYVSYQDDCYIVEVNNIESCLVVYDLHPQATAASVM
jgi:hypothetical protein